MLRRFAFFAVPLIDVLVFCACIAAGQSLRASSAYAFGIALVLHCSLRWRRVAAQWDSPRVFWRIVLVGLMALFLRSGVLALLVQRAHWLPQVAIFAAVALGLGVIQFGISARGRTLAFGLIAYAAALRVVYLGSVELLPEEAYYWNYSRHFDFGYLDHPPLTAWLIRLSTAIFGQNEFGVRFPALCCGVVTSIFVYKLARNLFGPAAALAALLFTQVLPYFFLSGLLMTPDALLAASWAGSLYFLERGLIGGQGRAWIYAGICLGLGMISKYSIALLAAVSLLFMLWDRESRQWLRRWQPYMGALLALLIFSPVVFWNFQHDWASFAFQTSRRLADRPQFALHKLIASIIVLITPTGMLALGGLLFAYPRGDDAGMQAARQRRLVGLAVLLPLAVFAVFSLRHEVKLDWSGPLLIGALPALGFWMLVGGATDSAYVRRIRAAWMPTLVIMSLIYGAGLHYLVLGLPGLGYGKHIEVIPVGWRDLSAHISDTAAAYHSQNGAELLVVGMDRYAIASELAFYGGSHPGIDLATATSHLFGGVGLMYAQWMPPQAQEHRDLLLVAFSPAELEDRSIQLHVARLGPIEDDVLTRDGSVIRHYYHRLAFDYRARETE